MKYVKQNELFMVTPVQDKLSGAAIFMGDKILLVKPTKYKSKKNGWSFPKGRIEAEHTTIQTALIEVKEETGIDVTEKDVMFSFNLKYIKNYKIKDLSLFGFKISDEILHNLLSANGKIKPELYHSDEICDISFFTYKEAIKVIEPPMVKALEKCFKVFLDKSL